MKLNEATLKWKPGAVWAFSGNLDIGYYAVTLITKSGETIPLHELLKRGKGRKGYYKIIGYQVYQHGVRKETLFI